MSQVRQLTPSQLTAEALLVARKTANALNEYPGEFPSTLHEAYEIQDYAISHWPDQVAGWKVGRIPEPLATDFGTTRLLGPIFKSKIVQSSAVPADMPVFAHGFAAVEAEFILEIAEDTPATKTDWSIDEAKEYVANVYAGIEIASSPFAGINDHGPVVTVSDFGNNFGLILGDKLDGILDQPLNEWTCKTVIEGAVVGENSAVGMPGGPLESVRLALINTSLRNLSLKKGSLISTGAITGVHQAFAGQSAVASFQGGHEISCILSEFTGE